jgi:hypothetical protein
MHPLPRTSPPEEVNDMHHTLEEIVCMDPKSIIILMLFMTQMSGPFVAAVVVAARHGMDTLRMAKAFEDPMHVLQDERRFAAFGRTHRPCLDASSSSCACTTSQPHFYPLIGLRHANPVM